MLNGNACLFVLGLAIACHGLWLGTNRAQAQNYDQVIETVRDTVTREMEQWNITGVSVALVEDQKTIFAEGFGIARRDSIFRAGSISKLFNAVAVMQRVQSGELNLDAPLPDDLLPLNPFPDQPKVTLRQLLSHRSGLQREPRVGSYLDVSEPGMSATVTSLRDGVLVTRPTATTRYSNIGPTLAGHMVERVSGLSYAAYQERHIVGPLGMDDSMWLRSELPEGRLVTSFIRVADGKGGWQRQETPLFDLGTIPAGNLYTTVDDLARFASALIEADPNGPVPPSMIRELWTPQFDSGFGLGFLVGEFDGHRAVRHAGAVYGYSSSFVLLPDLKIAVIVMGNEDVANARINAINDAVLRRFVAARTGVAPRPDPRPIKVADLDPFVGDYESQSYWAKLEVKNGKLIGNLSGQFTTFTPISKTTFLANSLQHNNARVVFATGENGIDQFTMAGQTYRRVRDDPPPLADHWRQMLGTYGLDLSPLIVVERYGHLYVMTENFVEYRLTPVNQHVCALPPGMYVNEHVVFMTDDADRVHRIDFANMIFDRRN